MSAVALTIQALKASPSVVALTTVNRIYPGKAPQSTSDPTIIVNLVYESDNHILTGPSGRFYTSRVQIDCRAGTQTAMLNLAETVKLALASIIRQTYASGVATFVKEGTDNMDFGDQQSLAQRTMDYYVYWR